MDGNSESNSMPVIPEGDDSLIFLEESDSVSLIPDNDDPKVSHARRYSTGDVDVPYARVRILSRYLSVAKGSCHDLCKYGTKQNLEANTMSPRLKTIPEMRSRSQELDKPETAAERKKKLAVMLTPRSPASRLRKPDIPATPKKEVSSLSKKGTGLSKQHSLPAKVSDVPATRVIDLKLNKALSKPSSFPKKVDSIPENKENTPSGKASSGRKTGFRKSKTISLSAIQSVKKALMRPLVSLAHKRTGKRVSNINAERLKKLEGMSCLKDQSDDGNREPDDEPRSEDVPEKTLHVIESSSEKRDLSNARDGIRTAQSDPPSKKKTSKHTQKGTQGTPLPASSENKSFRHNGATRSSVSSVQSFESSKHTRGSNSEISESENRTGNTKPENKSRQRKGGVTTNANDKDSPTKQLRFRKTKVVDLQSDISTPRRLKFRRRALSDIQISKAAPVKAKLRSTSVDDSEINVREGDAGEKVVLKHQDVEGKNFEQCLNNMFIEETASKLAETRKSKVKALVGAFETVISLQDSKNLSISDASLDNPTKVSTP